MDKLPKYNTEFTISKSFLQDLHNNWQPKLLNPKYEPGLFIQRNINLTGVTEQRSGARQLTSGHDNIWEGGWSETWTSSQKWGRQMIIPHGLQSLEPQMHWYVKLNQKGLCNQTPNLINTLTVTHQAPQWFQPQHIHTKTSKQPAIQPRNC